MLLDNQGTVTEFAGGTEDTQRLTEGGDTTEEDFMWTDKYCSWLSVP